MTALTTRRCENILKVAHLINYFQFSAPQLYDDGRWYWFYNSGLDPQTGNGSPSLSFGQYNSRQFTALYRSRDSDLPDFSKIKDTEAELYFDVIFSVFVTPNTDLIYSPMLYLRMDPYLSRFIGCRNAGSISHMASQILYVLLFINGKLSSFYREAIL